MLRGFSVLFVIAGIGCLVYGGWQIGFTQVQQEQSLQEAKALVTDQTDNSTDREVEGVQSAEELDPQEGDVIGILDIPRLERELPIISGTHEDELERGVGHYTSTSLPEQGDQILLSGHRDTVFRQMGDLEIGDHLTVNMSYGSFTYKIFETEIVDADDTTVIGSTTPDEILTLSTCYPFSYVGPAPDRYIIYAKRLP